jgi:membrane protease YdiL (CAAX protease family)
MWVLLYLVGMLGMLLAMQSVVLLAFNEPLQWTFGANSRQPKSLKLVLKFVLQGTLIGSLLLLPYLAGSNPVDYYGPMLPAGQFHLFLYGQALAVLMLVIIFAIETAAGWITWRPRWTVGKTLTKCGLSALSSLTVVSIEEPFFRGVLLQAFLNTLAWPVAIPLSAVIFSAAHFIRKVNSYWPAVGLAVLGIWLGVGYYKTGSIWLPMGLHSGGILAIGVHRAFLNYRGREWLVGTQTFPIAGAISIAVMLGGTVVTWFLF